MNMKKLPLPLLLIICFVIVTHDLNAQVLKTKLQVTVSNDLGNVVQGVTVTLYKTQADYENNENPVQAEKTSVKGQIIFKELKPVSYYVDARKGNLSNDGRGVKTTKLMDQ